VLSLPLFRKECGHKYPIEQQQPKGKLSTIDESDSNSIGVVQPQNSQSRKPRPLRDRSPLEGELPKVILLLIVSGLLPDTKRYFLGSILLLVIN
jgi:hypothetical protein